MVVCGTCQGNRKWEFVSTITQVPAHGCYKSTLCFCGRRCFCIKTIFHEALSPARVRPREEGLHLGRLSENLFGILSNRWQLFSTVLMLPPKSIETLVLAALTLHNYLRQRSSANIYCPNGLCDREIADEITVYGSWRQDIPSKSLFIPLRFPPRGHNSSADAKVVKETFKDFFFHEGAMT